MSGYSQQSAKRQKVREGKSETDYFQGIDKLEYNNMAAPSDTKSYRYYNNNERVHNRTMEDWLKFSVSFTEFRNIESQYGRHYTRPWDDLTNTMENHKRCIKALYDFCAKLGVKYYTAFDTDLVPWGENWDENRSNSDEIVEYVAELTQRYHVKLLWLAPDLHSHPRYASGAFTSNDAPTYSQAATQIKKCLELSQKLNAECFLLWPFKEGYDLICQTNVQKEMKLFAKVLKLTAEYKDRLNYRCQMLIMPYYHFGRKSVLWQHCQPENDLIKTYMWDVTSCLYFLKSYNLDRFYKVCTPPGHHMYMANVYNMLGGVFISNDIDHYDTKTFTLMMKCIVDQGTPPPGGINLKLSHSSLNVRDVLTSCVQYIEGAARGMRLATSMVHEQMFTKHLQQRYASYYTGFGSRLVTADCSLDDCEEYHKKNQSAHVEPSSKTEHNNMDFVFQRYLETSQHI